MDRRRFLKTAAVAVPCMWLPVQLTANQPLYETKFPAYGKPTITDEGVNLLLDYYFHVTEPPTKWWLTLLAHDMRPYPYGGCYPLSWDEEAGGFTNGFGNNEFVIRIVQDWYGVGLYSKDTMWSWSGFAKPVTLPIGSIDPGDVRKFDYISYREWEAESS